MPRLETISDSTGTLSSYKYLGADQIVEEDYVEASVKLTYLNSSGNVTGLDRFGRVTDQLWERYGDDPATLDEYTYTYDRAGNVTSRTNATHKGVRNRYCRLRGGDGPEGGRPGWENGTSLILANQINSK
jgi:hypothetical protein